MYPTACTDPLFEVTEGWTEPLGPFTLLADGVPMSLTGKITTIVLRRASGTLVTPGGTVVPDPDQITNPGQLMYLPHANDFIWESNLHTNAQTYQLHWKVVDGAQKVAYFPSGEPAEVIVHRA